MFILLYISIKKKHRMSTFLLGKHNLADIDDVEKARDNLGLGVFATFGPDDIEINGGVIKVDEFWLTSNAADDKVLKSDQYGRAYWGYVENCNYESNISQFANDANYITQHQALHPGSNLSDLSDKKMALSNLGLSQFLSTDETETLSFDSVNLDHLYISTLEENSVLMVGDGHKIKGTTVITHVDYVINDSSFSMIDSPQESLTSLKLMKDVYSNIRSNVYETQVYISDLESQLTSIQDPDGATNSFLKKNNFLNEFVNDKKEALSNLGIPDTFINIENQNITGNNLEINQLKYRIVSQEDYTKKPHFLTINGDGDTSWSEMPFASTSNEGSVLIVDSLDRQDNDPHKVFSRFYLTTQLDDLKLSQTETNASLCNVLSRVEEQINQINIPTQISTFCNNCNYLKAENYLSELTNNLYAVYSNLNLEEVAWTGSYDSLLNVPAYLAECNLDASYLRKDRMLEEFDGNYDMILSNLGLDDMALQSSSNIQITNGVIYDLKSIRTEELILDSNVPNYDSLGSILFMKAIDVNGTAGWDVLPSSTYIQPGLVHTISNQSDIDYISDNYFDYPYVYDVDYINAQLDLLTSKIDTNSGTINNTLNESLCNLESKLLEDIERNDVKIYEELNELSDGFDLEIEELKSNLDKINNGELDSLTLQKLFYKPEVKQYDTDENDDTISYHKVLVKGSKVDGEEWMSISNVFGNLKFTEVNRVDLHIVTTVNTKNLDVSESIQFDDGVRDPAKDIPHGCLIYSDNSAHMHWDNKLRLINHEDHDKIGLEFEQRSKADDDVVEHKMVFYQQDGKMIIGESLCNVIIPKHIFR